jgi:hypothetical protein
MSDITPNLPLQFLQLGAIQRCTFAGVDIGYQGLGRRDPSFPRPSVRGSGCTCPLETPTRNLRVNGEVLSTRSNSPL